MGGGEDPPGGGRAAARARRLLRYGAVVVGVVVMIYAAAAIVLRTLVEPRELARWLEPRAEAALNRPVELAGARVQVFPWLAVELDSVVVRDPPAFGDSHLARADEVELRVALLPLLRRRIAVDEVRVRSPELRLLVRPDGTSNFGDFLPAARDPERGRAAGGARRLSFRVRDVRLEEAALEYVDRSTGRATTLRSARLEGTLQQRSDGRWDIRTTMRADSVHLEGSGERSLRLEGIRSRLRLLAGPEFHWVEIREESSLGLGALDVTLGGRVDGVRDSVRRLDLRASIRDAGLGDVLGLLPDSTRQRISGEPSGTLEGSFTASGRTGRDRGPDVAGRLTLEDGALTLPGGARILEDGTLRVTLRHDTLRVERGDGMLLGGPLTLEGHAVMDSSRAYRALLEARPQASRLVEARRMQGVDADGSVSVQLRATGVLDRLHASQLLGEVGFHGVRWVRRHGDRGVPPMEVAIPEGTVELRGREARWRQLPLILGPDRLLATGSLSGLLNALRPDAAEAGARTPARLPVLRGTLQGRRLDLGRLFPPVVPDAPSYGRLAFARLGGHPVAGRSPESWARDLRLHAPDPPPLEARLALLVDSLAYGEYLLSSADLQVKLGPEILEILPASAGMWGGTVSSSFTLGIGGGESQRFSLQLETDGVDASALLERLTPLSRLATGALDLELDLTGRLDSLLLPVPSSLAGTGRFTLRSGRLRPNPVTRALGSFFGLPAADSLNGVRWSGGFMLSGGGVRLDSATLRSTLADFTVAGSVGYGGALDLALQMDLPLSRLSEFDLSGGRIPGETLERLRQRAEAGAEAAVPLGLRVVGRSPDLRVSLETGALAERLGAAARQAVTDSLENVLERGRREMRGRSERLLRRLLGARDSAAPPSDTAATAAPDTAGAAVPDTSRASEADTSRAGTAGRGPVPDPGHRSSRGVVSRSPPSPTGAAGTSDSTLPATVGAPGTRAVVMRTTAPTTPTVARPTPGVSGSPARLHPSSTAMTGFT